MAACGGGGGGSHVQTAVGQSPKVMHFRRSDVIPQPVPHSTDMQDGRPTVTWIKKYHPPKAEFRRRYTRTVFYC